ncbi:hypothetical protein NEIRO03_0091 [Nematocida sp. AWRm78]|nr:hypothetical protein NEIRO02_0096 [Nematocida sp. AWRm79]KAI5182407.1 hypothetical protein NEIRO03_0091 [Nematocida sp. AWRm78]
MSTHGKEITKYKDKVLNVLEKLVEKEKVYSKVSGVTFRFIRYKRALKECLIHEGSMESSADLINVKHIGKSIASEIIKEIEKYENSCESPVSNCKEANEEEKEELIVISDNSSVFEETANLLQKRQILAQNENNVNDSIFTSKKTEVSNEIISKYAQNEEGPRIREKKVGYVFTVKNKNMQIKTPVPFTLGHLILDGLTGEDTQNKSIDIGSLRYVCLERARKCSLLYGSRALFESTEKRVKHFSKILLRHGLIEDYQNSISITEIGKSAARLLSSACRSYNKETNGILDSRYIENPSDAQDGAQIDLESADIQPMLLIDIREKKTREDPYFFHSFLSHAGVKAETRVLSIGDFLWSYVKNMQEYYCNLLIERKTIRDLLQSVRDGRYREQKERLLSLPGNKMYCIEGNYPTEKSVVKMMYTVAYGLISSGFIVVNPWKVEETLFIIEKAHKIVTNRVNKKDILYEYSSDGNATKKDENEDLLENLLTNLHRKKLTDYTEIEQSLIILQSIKGVSYSTASTIVSKIGRLSVLIKKSTDRQSLLEELACLPTAKKNRTLGTKKAHSILMSLGL